MCAIAQFNLEPERAFFKALHPDRANPFSDLVLRD